MHTALGCAGGEAAVHDGEVRVREGIVSVEAAVVALGRHLEPIRRYATGDARLERSAYTLLGELQRRGSMTIAELCEAFALDASTVNRQTAAVVRSGLAERFGDPDGGPARRFRLTEEGRRRLERDRSANIASLAEALSDWSDAELASFSEMVRRFNGDVHDLLKEWRTRPSA